MALSEEQIARNLRDVAYAVAQQHIEGLTVSAAAQTDMRELAHGRLTIAECIERMKARYTALASDKRHLTPRGRCSYYVHMAHADSIHPGQVVREQCLAPHGLSVVEAAQALGVSRQALSNVLTGKAGISPEMAIRLAKAFGGDAEHWLQLQLAHDLAQARQRDHLITVMPIDAYKAQRPTPQPKML